MAQKKNSVSLTDTAIARLQKLVDTGEYCSLDDAASHIIVSTLPSTGQYAPVLANIQPKPIQSEPPQSSTTPVRNTAFEAKTNNSKPRPPIEGL
jgi:hypothetical protein